MIDALIKQKQAMRRTRPKFRRSNAQNIKRISRTSYRKPKGLHNKMKDQRTGHKSVIKTGFGYPKLTRGLAKDGRKMVHVESFAELEAADPKTTTIIISSSLGIKKKILILQKAIEKKMVFYNVKDASAYVALLSKQKKDKSRLSEIEAKAREEAKKNALKHKEGKKVEPQAAPADAAEKKEAEKKEQDKVLTSKE